MSADTVDDLHYAEDQVSRLAWQVAHLKLGLRDGDLVPPAAFEAEMDGYCRPTCGWMSTTDPADRECESGGADDCGCLCGHPEASRRADP